VKYSGLVLLFCCSFARSESIRGAVIDPTGAVLPNAIVDLSKAPLTDLASTRADPRGLFQFSGLAPGRYDIAIQAEGFTQTVLHNVTVVAGKELVLDPVTLKISAGDAPLLIEKVDQRFRIASVRIEKIRVSSRGLASIPVALLERSWKNQGILLTPGSQSDSGVIVRAKELIERTYDRYASPVRVEIQMDPRAENPMAPLNPFTTITFRVIERCECH
jgi:Carboxypeptidase regulatory-like domain